MARTNDTRSKMIASTALLIRESGVEGTSFAKVLEHSGSPRGSISHHFPGGKQEMVEEAIVWAGSMATSLMRQQAKNGESTAEIFATVTTFYRDALVQTDFRAGCPIGVAAQESHQSDGLRREIKAVFDNWLEILSTSLTSGGHSQQESRELAQLTVASVEGALLMARIDRSTAPVDAVIRQISPLLDPEE